MTFTSAAFPAFLCGVMVLAVALGRRRRWLVLLAASFVFYAASAPLYLLATLATVTVVTFGCGLAIERTSGPRRRKALLGAGLLFIVGALGVLKYSGFADEMLNAAGTLAGWRASLPTGQLFASIGVSYYSLQAISYLLDVHDRAIPAERHLGLLALFLAFFPKMLEGPIERPENLLPQLRAPPAIATVDLAAGLQRMLWGLFQKVVVADSIAPFVNAVYGNVRGFDGLSLVIATYFFAAQLYFDFAGYTDMAIGAARLFGVRLSPNFQSPYLARSIGEFWRRWHISFSSWLLDYVFRPLQMRFRDWRTWGTPVALVLTFLVSGIWHGASWGFVVWGLLHGGLLATSVLFRPWRTRVRGVLRVTGSPLLAPVQVVLTFNLVCFSWIFFRASSLADASWVAIRGLAGLPGSLAGVARGHGLESLVYLGQGRGRFLFVIAMIAFGTALRAYFRRLGVTSDEPGLDMEEKSLASPWGRAVVYALMVYAIVFHGTATQGFLYEQY